MKSLPFTHRYFIVVHDLFSKWPEVLPTSTITSSVCITALLNLFSRWGLPEQVTTDNGRQFVSAEFEDFLQSLGILHKTTALYCPQQNGGVERFNAVLKNGIRTHLADGKDINEAVRQTLLAYRSSPHTVSGTSPAELMLGRRLRMPLDRLLPSLPRVTTASEPMQLKGEMRRPTQQRRLANYDFAIGSYVRVKRPKFAKFEKAISDPLRIVSRSGNTYTLEDGNKWHASRCTSVPDPTPPQTPFGDMTELPTLPTPQNVPPERRLLPERSRHPPQFYGNVIMH